MDVRIQSGFKLVLAAALILGCTPIGRFTTRAIIIPQPPKGGLQLTSTAFKNREAIPVDYTCDGKNLSPPLAWTGTPDKTKSFVLIADDPDVPGGGCVHWIIYNLPAAATNLAADSAKAESLPGNAKQGTNDFKQTGYGGPCPSPGKLHRYFFRLFALDAPLDLQPGATRKEVEAAMAKHIMAQTQLMGTYQRK